MKFKLIFLVFFLLAVSLEVNAQQDSIKTKKKLSFRHHEDGAFDVSAFLLDHNGVLPVIIPITEPAVGYGGALAVLYFHKKKKKYKTFVAPDVTGLVGLYTSNKTWGAGAFHAHTFGENRVRTLTAVMKPNVKFKYYGNDSPLLANNPIGINLDSWLVYQQAQARIGNSNFYIGGAYTYFKSEVSFEELPNNPLLNLILQRLNTNSTISQIKPLAIYDNRNNTFTPTKGILSELGYNYSATWLGSDDDFGTLSTNFFGYLPITEKLLSKYRFQGSFLFGDAPFYAYPFVDLRGIAAMRYQNETTLVTETEWAYNVYNRWWVSAFGGTGKAFSDFNDFGSEDWVYNIGTGFRYSLAKDLGLDMGADFALGNGKDFAFYIVFGTSW